MNISGHLSSFGRAIGAAGGRNAAFSVAAVLTNPVLQLLATPVLIAGLGLTDFGVWAFINALIAIGVTSVGLGEAATKYVALHRARNDLPRVIATIRTLLTVYTALGLALASALWAAAPWMAAHAFHFEPSRAAAAVAWLHLAAAAVFFKFVYAVFEAVVRGFFRYDIEAVCGMANTAGATLFAFACVRLGHGLGVILAGTVAILAVCTAVLCAGTRAFTGTWRFLVPGGDRAALRESFGFGAFTWFQALNCIVVHQLDRVIVGALAGAAALGYYVVCCQLVQTAHAVLSRGGAFLFPLIVRYREERRREELWSLFRRGMALVTCAGWALSGGLLVFGGDFLAFWIGPDFAEKAAPTLRILAIWNAFLATSVVSFYFLNATGGERANALLGLAGAGVFLGGAKLLIPLAGTVGAAVAKLASVADGIVARTVLFRREFAFSRWWSGLVGVAPTALAVGVTLLIQESRWGGALPHWPRAIAAFCLGSAVCLTGCWAVYARVLRRASACMAPANRTLSGSIPSAAGPSATSCDL